MTAHTKVLDKVALAALEVAIRATITTIHQQHIIVAIVMAKAKP